MIKLTPRGAPVLLRVAPVACARAVDWCLSCRGPLRAANRIGAPRGGGRDGAVAARPTAGGTAARRLLLGRPTAAFRLGLDGTPGPKGEAGCRMRRADLAGPRLARRGDRE